MLFSISCRREIPAAGTYWAISYNWSRYAIRHFCADPDQATVCPKQKSFAGEGGKVWHSQLSSERTVESAIRVRHCWLRASAPNALFIKISNAARRFQWGFVWSRNMKGYAARALFVERIFYRKVLIGRPFSGYIAEVHVMAILEVLRGHEGSLTQIRHRSFILVKNLCCLSVRSAQQRLLLRMILQLVLLA